MKPGKKYKSHEMIAFYNKTTEALKTVSNNMLDAGINSEGDFLKFELMTDKKEKVTIKISIEKIEKLKRRSTRK